MKFTDLDAATQQLAIDDAEARMAWCRGEPVTLEWRDDTRGWLAVEYPLVGHSKRPAGYWHRIAPGSRREAPFEQTMERILEANEKLIADLKVERSTLERENEALRGEVAGLKLMHREHEPQPAPKSRVGERRVINGNVWECRLDQACGLYLRRVDTYGFTACDRAEWDALPLAAPAAEPARSRVGERRVCAGVVYQCASDSFAGSPGEIAVTSESTGNDVPWDALRWDALPIAPGADPKPETQMQPRSPTWNCVVAFADQMEAKLERNRHKGDREGWLKDTPSDLLKQLREEVDELELAIARNYPPWCITGEAADVGNFAMMVADCYDVRAAAVKQPAEAQPATCAWTHDPDADKWDTGCGQSWTLLTGDPSANSMRFCHGCGRAIALQPSAPPEAFPADPPVEKEARP